MHCGPQKNSDSANKRNQAIKLLCINPLPINQIERLTGNAISPPTAILNNAFFNAISSPDYSYKSANKNPITSRSGSGAGR